MLACYYKFMCLVETILNIIIVSILNIKYLYRKTYYPPKKSDTIQILGNGPSLNNDIPKIFAKRLNNSLMVVNTFATTELFDQIKPEYYIIVDPAFFSPSENERIRKIQETTQKSLIDKTKWDLTLFVPFSSKKSNFIKELEKGNEFIRIIYFKNIPVIGGSDKINTFLFKNNLANPLFQNVLIAGIFIGIKMKFSNIHLFGADHSWLTNLKVLDDNSVILNDKHITQNNTNYTILYEENGDNKKLHKFLFQIASMFREYHSLFLYSKKMTISIKNHTEDSYIDAFEKKNF